MKDYYYILGIEKNASPEEIKMAHRKLSKKFHPDLNPNDSHSEKMFKDIQEAYEFLIDQGKRKQYDYAYANWTKGNQQGNTYTEKTENSIDLKDKANTLSAVWIFLFLGFGLVQLIVQNSSGSDKEHWLLFGLIGSIALPAFMAPFLVAIWNRHPLKWAVFGANIILGWTGLGWIGCLVFSLYKNSKI